MPNAQCPKPYAQYAHLVELVHFELRRARRDLVDDEAQQQLLGLLLRLARLAEQSPPRARLVNSQLGASWLGRARRARRARYGRRAAGGASSGSRRGGDERCGGRRGRRSGGRRGRAGREGAIHATTSSWWSSLPPLALLLQRLQRLARGHELLVGAARHLVSKTIGW